MTRLRNPTTSVSDRELKRAINALNRAGMTREAKRLDNNLPSPNKGK